MGYKSKTDRWLNLGRTPVSRVNLPTAPWHDQFVLPSGEVRPIKDAELAELLKAQSASPD